jgi:hypothetical protein
MRHGYSNKPLMLQVIGKENSSGFIFAQHLMMAPGKPSHAFGWLYFPCLDLCTTLENRE